MTNQHAAYEDVCGATEVDRELLLRHYAAMQLIVLYGGGVDQLSERRRAYIRETFTANEFHEVQRELRRLYKLDERDVDECLDVLRAMVDPVDPHDFGDITDYRVGTVDDCPDDGIGWLA